MVERFIRIRFAAIAMGILLISGCLGLEPVANSEEVPPSSPAASPPPVAKPGSNQFYAYTNSVSCETLLKNMEDKENRNNMLLVIGGFISGANYAKSRNAGINIKTLAAVTEDYCRKTPQGNLTQALIYLDRSIDKALAKGPQPAVPSVTASPAANQAQTNSPPAQPPPAAVDARPAGAAPATAGDSYGVQIHSTQDIKDADYYFSKLESRKYPAYITKVDLGGKGIWYRVMCGPFNKQADAEKAMGQLEKQGIKGFIRKVETAR